MGGEGCIAQMHRAHGPQSEVLDETYQQINAFNQSTSTFGKHVSICERDQDQPS